MIAYRDNGNSNYGTAIVGTVSGTSISFGSESVFGTSSVENTQNVYDSGNGKTNIFYKDGGDSDKGDCWNGVRNKHFLYNPRSFYDTATISALSAVYDSNSKV